VCFSLAGVTIGTRSGARLIQAFKAVKMWKHEHCVVLSLTLESWRMRLLW
jgi:hypothetical protein